jgi:hypothetical protein
MAVVIGLVATTAHTQTADPCERTKSKCVRTLVERLLRCHALAERRNRVVDTACFSRVTDAFSNPDENGCWDRLETRGDCQPTGSAAAIAIKIDGFVLDVVTALDPSYPAPILNPCSASKKKCVSDKAVGLLACYAKAEVDAACLLKTKQRFDGSLRLPPAPAKGCFAKLETQGNCLTVDDTAALETEIDTFVDDIVCTLDPLKGTCRPTPTPTPTLTPMPSPTSTIVDECFCGDGVNGPCEACDPSAPSSGWSGCGPDFTCTPSCNCACPTKVTLSTSASDAATIMDLGWTGIAHREPEIGDGDVTLSIACGATSRPCGVCTVTGPIANPLADDGQIDNHRCTNDTRIKCSSEAPCVSGGGSCQFFAGSDWSFAVGGIGVCATRQFGGGISGTANVETGAVATTGGLVWKLYLGSTVGNACPRCVGDGAPNDGVAGGTCSEGLHSGLTCDANGIVPSRPDFGATSLDCPPPASSLIATLPLLLDSSTTTVTETLGTSNPICTGAPSKRCLCSTCNNGNAEPCMTNADCPDPAGPVGPICGGRRCDGGINDGVPCNSNSECTAGGGICTRAGEPTKPNGCLDDTSTPVDGSVCADTAPVGDNEGACPDGPIAMSCTNHPQRGCASDADCDNVVGTCVQAHRPCFLDNGVIGGAIVAAGMTDTPVADRFTPTRAAVFCMPATDSSSTNNVLGVPGPGRATQRGLAVFHP